MKKITLLAFTILATLVVIPITKVSFAETPCSHLGHDKIEYAMACLQNTRRIRRTRPIIPLRTVSYNPNPYYTTASILNAVTYGYRYGYYNRIAYPRSSYNRGIYLSPLPTDIITYNE